MPTVRAAPLRRPREDHQDHATRPRHRRRRRRRPRHRRCLGGRRRATSWPPAANATRPTPPGRRAVRRGRPGPRSRRRRRRPRMAADRGAHLGVVLGAWNVDVRSRSRSAAPPSPGRCVPGATVLIVSSGAAIGGSPLSGGYAGAKRTQMFLADYLQRHADLRGLGIRFVALAPRQLLAGTATGEAAAAAYGRRRTVPVGRRLHGSGSARRWTPPASRARSRRSPPAKMPRRTARPSSASRAGRWRRSPAPEPPRPGADQGSHGREARAAGDRARRRTTCRKENQMSATHAATGTAIRPFQVAFSDEELADLRRRIDATRWPERETVADDVAGRAARDDAGARALLGDRYDWRTCEAQLNALPQFITEIDGLDIHFIHVRSRHEDALPLIVTHGWPGSIIEQLKIIEPLTDPTAHGAARGRVRSGDPVAARPRVLRQADRDRVGPAHRAGLDGADEAPRLHPLRGPGRRLGCGRHPEDGHPGGHPSCSASTPTCPAPCRAEIASAPARRTAAGRPVGRGAARLRPADASTPSTWPTRVDGDAVRRRSTGSPTRRSISRRSRSTTASPASHGLIARVFDGRLQGA